MQRSFGLLLALSGFALLVLSATSAPSHAQSADQVLCDRIAADPADPDKPADVKGVNSVAPSDVPIALKYCKAAASKSRRAIYQLGRAYAANRQMAEAIKLYRQAIAKGSTGAMVELGVLLGTGAGVAKDPDEARKLFERAAKAGNARGATNLAALQGGAAAANPAEARALYARAAEGNSAEAQFQLGLLDAQGIGGPKDDAAARTLFEKAAAQGHADANMWAGAFWEIGRGGPKDDARAKAYYEKAAALGNPQAKEALHRIECPRVMKDKNGNILTHLCF
ncbi:MAG: sel1 repeat family protein [Rhodopseudomonas sp.]|nr:sel1 repeat family protein [Rhodopseudomonas sp.]